MLAKNNLSFIGDFRSLEEATTPDGLHSKRSTLDSLSETHFDGKLFDSEFTFLSTSREIGSLAIPYYDIESHILFSVESRAYEPFGFYSLSRVKDIQKILNSFGLQSEILDENGFTTLSIHANEDTELFVDFGYQSREHLRRFYEQEIRDADNSFSRDLWWKKLMIEMEGGLSNREIKVDFISKVDENNTHIFLEDEQSLIKNLIDFASAYEKLLKSLCNEGGFAFPNVPIILSTPYDIQTKLRLE